MTWRLQHDKDTGFYHISLSSPQGLQGPEKSGRLVKVVRNDGAVLKKERLDEMERILNKDDEIKDLDMVIATFEYRLGLSQKKVIEYLQILAKLRLIRIDEDKIYPVGSVSE